MAKSGRSLLLALSCLFVIGQLSWNMAAFIAGPLVSRPGPNFRGASVLRTAEAETQVAEVEAQAEETPMDPKSTVSIVLGADRMKIAWDAEETCATLRERIAEATGIPANRQELKLASAELLGEEEELRSSYKGTNVQTIWLEDLRTAEEKGEKEDTIIDQLQQLWKLDNVTVLSVLLVVYTFIKELLPLFIEGVKNPLQDLPWQPGPIDQFPPSAF
mmetsp:Transcript_13562/g.28312  ORF Transcript_13562/g.28312 Transcript_13562/m.28312 type:complete len:217 (+) Transcript_13562:68-718(+)